VIEKALNYLPLFTHLALMVYQFYMQNDDLETKHQPLLYHLRKVLKEEMILA